MSIGQTIGCVLVYLGICAVLLGAIFKATQERYR